MDTVALVSLEGKSISLSSLKASQLSKNHQDRRVTAYLYLILVDDEV